MVPVTVFSSRFQVKGGFQPATSENQTALSGGPPPPPPPARGAPPPDKAVWFSDVAGWNPPLTWNLDENTVTGTITKNTGVYFEMNIPPEDGAAKLSLMLVSGTLPDVMSITDGNMIRELIEAGKVWKMEELLKTYDPASHLLKDFPNDIKQVLMVRDGDWYAFPSHIASPDAQKTYPPAPFYEDYFKYSINNAFMWDNKVLELAGLSKNDLQTEAQVLAAWRKVKAMNLTVNGAAVMPLMLDANYQSTSLWFLLNSFGAEEVDQAGNYHDRLLAPQAKHALKFLNTLYREGIIDAGQLTYDDAQVRANFASGRVLSFMGNPAGMGAEKTHGNYWSSGPIVSSDGARPVMSKAFQPTGGWMQTFISKGTKNPAALAKWLSYMSGSDGIRLAYLGLPGVDYNINAAGQAIITAQGAQNKENQSKTGVFAYWPFHHTAWTYSSIMPAPAGDHPEVNYQQVSCALGKYKDTYIYDASLLERPTGFIDPNSDIGIIQLQIENFKKSQISAIVTAASDAAFESAYNTLISRLKSLGIDQLDAKINEAVQANYRRYSERIQKVNP
jgi:putative aldouronate transport system substrate-binding protein